MNEIIKFSFMLNVLILHTYVYIQQANLFNEPRKKTPEIYKLNYSIVFSFTKD